MRILKHPAFVVNDKDGHKIQFASFEDAAGFAASNAVATGKCQNVDVYAFTRKAACNWFENNSEKLQQWEKADPKPAILERFVVRVESVGSL